GHLLAEPRYLEAARGALGAGMTDIQRDPLAHATLVRVLGDQFDPPEHILLRGDPARLDALAVHAAASFRPGRFVFALAPHAGAGLDTLPEFPAGGVVARRCRGTTCDAPVTDGDAIAAMIAG
ncbi:MAG: thioredoxin domain-containing protein, partial [Halofilum sp. (in: g-proteobacteria)]